MSDDKPDARNWEWPINTVGRLISNLQTLPPEMPFYTAYFVEIGGKMIAKTTHPSVSRETVAEGRIQKFDEAKPSLVIWATATPYAPSAERYTHAFKVPIRWRYNAKGQVQIVDADDRIVPIENVLASINLGATPSAIEPTEAEVEEAAKIIAATPLIDAPRLNWQQWCGLARRILSVRGSESRKDG